MRERAFRGVRERAWGQQRVGASFAARHISFVSRHKICYGVCDLTGVCLVRLPHPRHGGYDAHSGILRDEAIMILRRFYITENTNGEYRLCVRLLQHIDL